jgi:hypothetical protein
MALYKITFAKFYEVTIEANSKDEAEDKACTMEEEEVIEKADNDDFQVWNVPCRPYLNIPLGK